MVTVKKTLPTELDVDSNYTIKVRSINSFGVPSDWSESLVINTHIGFRKVVQTDDSLTVYRDNGETAFSYTEADRQRVNYVINPSFETNINGWQVGTSSPVSVSSVLTGLFGSRSMSVNGINNALAGNDAVAIQTNAAAQAILPDDSYCASAYVKPWASGKNFYIKVTFYNVSFVSVGSHTSNTFTSTNTNWMRMDVSGKAPAGAAWAAISVACQHKLVIGQFFRVDGVLFEKGTAELGPYFDGTSATGVTSWTGIPHGSTSVYETETSNFYLSNELTIGGTGRLSVTKTGAAQPSFLVDATSGLLTIRDGLDLNLYSSDGIAVFTIDGGTGGFTSRGSATINGQLTVSDPFLDSHAATKRYVDGHVYTPDIYEVDSQAEMLALLATAGDYAIRSDLPDDSSLYILREEPASVLANWVVMPTGGGSAAVAAHEAAPDPHPQYMTLAESDSLYRDASYINTGTLSADRLPGTINSHTTGTAAAWTNTRTLTLSGDATGNVGVKGDAAMTLEVTVLDDSHTHDTRYYTETESDNRFVNVTGDVMTGDLEVVDLTVGGDLIVNGTTTTVNSTIVTIDDPIFTLGGDTAPTVDDNKDRGIEFRYHDGTTGRRGFFGFDDSTGKFTFLTLATNLNEVFTGTKGEADMLVDWSNVINKSIVLGVDTEGNYVGGLLGTANQITINPVPNDEGSIRQLALPQNIHTGATPTFGRLTLTQATGTPPLTVSSTTKVANLNVDLFDDHSSEYFATQEVVESLLGDLLFAGLYDPTGYSGRGTVDFPGSPNNIMYTAGIPAYQITGDITHIFSLQADDWSTDTQTIAAFSWPQGWMLRLRTSGDNNYFSYNFYDQGNTQRTLNSPVFTRPANTETVWFAITIDINNGSGGTDLRLFKSVDEGGTWAQEGSTVTGAFSATAASYTGSVPLVIGGQATANSSNQFRGAIGHYAFNSGTGASFVPGGTPVFELDATTDLLDPDDTTVTTTTGDVMTVTRQYNVASVTFPGTTGNYLSAPDNANLDITGDITLIARITPNDWTPAADQVIVGKWNNTGNQRSYRFELDVAGTLSFFWSTNGTDNPSLVSDANLSALPDGSSKWVAVTVDADNGAGNRVVRFWTADDGIDINTPGPWTQLGSNRNGAVNTMFVGTSTADVGAHTAGASLPFAGTIRNVQIRNGIGASGEVGGTEVLTIGYRSTAVSASSTSFTARTGQTITVNRSGGSQTALNLGTETLTLNSVNHTKPRPTFTGTTYRHGMYWVAIGIGELDFIDADLSGRYDEERTFQIVAKSLASNVATITTAEVHNADVGDTIFIAGLDSVFDGRYVVSAKTTYTISYAKTNANISETPVLERVYVKVISDMPVSVSYGDWIICIDPELAINGPGADLTLSEVTFQWIPFSSETYVKSQIALHVNPVTSPDPHTQYLTPERGAALFLPIDADFDADIEDVVELHMVWTQVDITSWTWNADSTLVLTAASNYLQPGTYIDIAGVHDLVDGTRRVHDVVGDLVTILLDPPATPPVTLGVPIPVTVATLWNNPHPMYLTEDEADEIYAPLDHEHSYEPLGAVDAHVEHADPHTQYLLESEAELDYAPIVHYHPEYAETTHTHPEILEVHATDGAAGAEIWVGSTEPTYADGLRVGDLWFETLNISIQPPSQVSGFTLLPVNGHQINLTWNAWHESEDVTRVQVDVLSGGVWTNILDDATLPLDTFINHTTQGITLVENTAYSYRIRGKNAATANSGWGDYVTKSTSTLNDPPAAPTSVSLTAPSSTSISLTWTDVAGLTYDVYVNGVFDSNVAGPPVTKTGKVENTTYSMGVRAQDAQGAVSAIVTDTVTTPNATPPVPTGLALSSRTHNSITVTWNAVTASDLKDYQTTINDSNGAYSTTRSRTFTGLAASTSYVFNVRSRDNSLAFSAFSSDVAISTLANPDTTPPNDATITSFKPEVSYGQMWFRFTTPSNSDFNSYYVQRKENTGAWVNVTAWTVVAPSTARAHNIGTFSAGDSVYARVIVRDDLGNQRIGPAVGYYLVSSPYTISPNGSTTWKDVNGGTYNFDGNYRPYMGYVSDSKFNARGMFIYGTQPTALYYDGRRTFTDCKIYLKREACGNSAPATPILALHQFTSTPASGGNQSAPTMYGTPTSSGVSLTTPAVGGTAAWGTVPLSWAELLVAGTYRGIAIYNPGGPPYLCLSSVSENSSSGDLRFYHLG
jgi:chitodextrinase